MRSLVSSARARAAVTRPVNRDYRPWVTKRTADSGRLDGKVHFPGTTASKSLDT